MNINDIVSVTLTQYGADLYNKYNFESRWPTFERKEGDVYRSQLWHILQIFGGDNISLGGTVPFIDIQQH